MFKCPRCSDILTTCTSEGIDIEVCRGCEGTWLDADELKELAQKSSNKMQQCEEAVVLESKNPAGEMKCPKCPDVQLVAFIYAFDSGIELDRCPQCQGLWLDKSELEQVSALMSKNEQHTEADLERFASFQSSGLSRYSGFFTWLGRILMQDRYGRSNWSD